MTLDELATELLILIATSLAPNDAFNLAITSRTLWQQCSVVIEEHQVLAEQYYNLVVEDLQNGPPSVSENSSDGKRPKTAWGLFRIICSDPRIAYHVREIENPSQGWEEADPAAQAEERRLCREAALGSTAVRGIKASALEEAIKSQHYQDLFFLLLQMCPNTQTLRYQDGNDDTDRYRRFFHGLIYGTGSARPRTLEKLTTAFIEHWDTEGSISLDYIWEICQLPSLRTVAGNMIGISGTPTPPELPTSNLTTLDLQSSRIDVASLEALIARIKALERFKYVDGGAIVNDEDTDLCGIISVLAEYHGHSLLHLHVTAGASNWPDAFDEDVLVPFSGFKGFVKLESLSTEMSIFAVRRSSERDYMGELDESFRLSDDLPETLRALSVTYTVSYSSTPVEVITANLVRSKLQHTPHLQKLSIPSDGLLRLDSEATAARIEDRKFLEAACEAYGVTLKYRR